MSHIIPPRNPPHQSVQSSPEFRQRPFVVYIGKKSGSRVTSARTCCAANSRAWLSWLGGLVGSGAIYSDCVVMWSAAALWVYGVRRLDAALAMRNAAAHRRFRWQRMPFSEFAETTENHNP